MYKESTLNDFFAADSHVNSIRNGRHQRASNSTHFTFKLSNKPLEVKQSCAEKKSVLQPSFTWTRTKANNVYIHVCTNVHITGSTEQRKHKGKVGYCIVNITPNWEPKSSAGNRGIPLA